MRALFLPASASPGYNEISPLSLVGVYAASGARAIRRWLRKGSRLSCGLPFTQMIPHHSRGGQVNGCPGFPEFMGVTPPISKDQGALE